MTAGGNFFDDFIDDYFSECDEHLATVRRVLLAFDESPNSAPEASLLQELLRALHTLKGLSGMVSLDSAEDTAHGMEDCVRAIPRGDPVPARVLETLFEGEVLLEQCVASRRSGAPSPSPAPYVARVQDVLREVTPDIGANAVPSPTQVVPHAGARPRRFEFVPSAELAQRGVGVEMIRRRLASLGTVTATTPRVRASGGVLFEFVVEIADGVASPPDEWRDDGLAWEPWAAAALPNPHGVVVRSGQPTVGAVPMPASNVVRVDLTRLDELMRLVGELVVTRSRLGELVARASSSENANTWDDLNEANEAIERQLRTIREGVMRIRLVPIAEVFERMRFAMRDVARETGKAIQIDFSGQDTAIDKLVVDRLLEPLLHLVRNSASHGIEDRAERVALGKPPDGRISLRAQASGDRIVLEVEDDGAGIDVERVMTRARQTGLVRTSDVLAPDALLDVICSPGFSTRDSADRSSGRGVGMGVVRSTIRALGGELFVHSVVRQGTRFTIELPLTLMITDALLLEVGDQTMAIPQIALREIVPLDSTAVTRFENNEVLSHRGTVIPLVNLGALFKLPPRTNAPRHVLIVGSDRHPAGLLVDRIVGLREIVVHPVPDELVNVAGVAGATELSNGRVSLILDAGALVRGARDGRLDTQTRALASTAAGEFANGAQPEEPTWA